MISQYRRSQGTRFIPQKAFASRTGLTRSRIFIREKLGGIINEAVPLASKTYSNTKETILKDIETSLKTRGTDHLDIYHQHSRHTPEEITDEMIETMELVKQQWKTRFIGVSTHDPNAMVVLF